MKKSTAKIKAVLLCRKGESLIESLASLLIFLILLMAITAMIKTALHITAEYTADAASRQNVVNAAVMENYGTATPDGALKLVNDDVSIDVSINVYMFDSDDYTAFRPVT